MFEGVRYHRAYRMVAAVNACVFLGGVLHTDEPYPGKTYKCAGRGGGGGGGVQITLVRPTQVKITSVL